MYYDESMDTTPQLSKNMTLRYRQMAAVVLVIFLVLFVSVFFVVQKLSNFGAIIDPNTGMILQVYMSHPNAQDLSLTDRVVSINGKPISQVQPEEFLNYKNSLRIEVVSDRGDTRPVTLVSVEPDLWYSLESMALPIMGFLFFLPGLALVFAKEPQLSDMHLFMFGFFGGVLLLMSQTGQLVIPWVSTAYLLSGVLASWSFLEFHSRYLAVHPPKILILVFRLLKTATAFILLWGGISYFISWHRPLNVLMVVNMVFDILVLITLFITQLRRNEFRVGVIRTFFLTSVVATMPLILFNYLPFVFKIPRYISVIVSAMPILIIPINYFILLLNRKKWLRTALVILSFTFAIFTEQIVVIIANTVLPTGLPDYRVSNYWLDFLISAAVLGIFLALYLGTYNLFHRLIYGDVGAISKRLYRKGYSSVEEGENERPLIQMAHAFMRDFYRYSYLNICLVDGTVMQFDEDNQLELHQFDEGIMNQLIQQLGRDNSTQPVGTIHERIVPVHKLEQIRDQFPHIFGSSPRYCYILFGSQGPIGFIAAGERKEGEPFDLVEMQQLNFVLNQFQVIVQNLLLIDKLEKTSQQIRLSGQQSIQMRENERRRIARDMHDNIIQAITAFRYKMNELYDSDKLTVTDVEADELQHHLMTITQDIRDICFDLRPPALDATGLHSAVVSLVESYHSRNELYIDLKVNGEAILNNVSEGVAICLYRVLQESLLNITKHADTKLAMIILNADENGIEMVIEDDGKGFSVPEHIIELVAEGHFGLMGSQEFLDVVKGSFHVVSKPGKGATIKAVIPLIREEGEHGILYDYRR